MFSTCAHAIVMYIMLNIFLTFRSRTIMVFHKGKMYRMGNGNIPPFTKEILLLICSVREMFCTCAQAIVKTTAYIVGYRNTAMSKAPTRIRPQLWTTVGSNHVQTYQLEMHMSLSGHPLKMIRPMVMKWSTRKDYIQYVLYCLYVDNHRVCMHMSLSGHAWWVMKMIQFLILVIFIHKLAACDLSWAPHINETF